MPAQGDRALLGWRLRSDIPIAVLNEWSGPPDSPVDVTLTRGPVEADDDPDAGPVRVTLLDDGSTVVVAQGIGRFLVRDGSAVIADVLPGVLPGIVEMIVIGPVLGMLCYQRGLLTLHANTVAIDGRAVALCGQSGAGKSTLAALLAARGHVLVSDDVLPIRREGGETLAFTANRHLRLWRETLEWLGHRVDGLRRAAPEPRDKYFLPPPAGPVAATFPLAAVVWIDAASHDEDRIEVLGGVARAQAVLKSIYRLHLVKGFNRRGQATLGDIGLPGVDVCLMRRRRGFDRLAEQADRIEALVRKAAA